MRASGNLRIRESGDWAALELAEVVAVPPNFEIEVRKGVLKSRDMISIHRRAWSSFICCNFVLDRATHPRKEQGWVATIVEPRQKDNSDPMAERQSPPDPKASREESTMPESTREL
jgi:hypothetical protein